MRHPTGFVALLALALVTAGCVGSPSGGQQTADTATPTPAAAENIDFPDGPQRPPARPSTLNASSVREYVRTTSTATSTTRCG